MPQWIIDLAVLFFLKATDVQEQQSRRRVQEQQDMAEDPDAMQSSLELEAHRTCLHLLGAVSRSDTSEVSRIMEMDRSNESPDIRNKFSLFCRTAVFLAVSLDSTLALRALLDGGTPINIHGFKGDTLLHFAAKRNRVQVAETLVERGVDLEARNDERYTAWGGATHNYSCQEGPNYFTPRLSAVDEGFG